jgi:hypothetical protein
MGINVTFINRGVTRAIVNKSGGSDGIRIEVPAGGGGGSGASRLQDLSDVDVTQQHDGDPLTYDGANNKYVIETTPLNGGTF